MNTTNNIFRFLLSVQGIVHFKSLYKNYQKLILVFNLTQILNLNVVDGVIQQSSRTLFKFNGYFYSLMVDQWTTLSLSRRNISSQCNNHLCWKLRIITFCYFVKIIKCFYFNYFFHKRFFYQFSHFILLSVWMKQKEKIPQLSSLHCSVFSRCLSMCPLNNPATTLETLSAWRIWTEPRCSRFEEIISAVMICESVAF